MPLRFCFINEMQDNLRHTYFLDSWKDCFQLQGFPALSMNFRYSSNIWETFSDLAVLGT